MAEINEDGATKTAESETRSDAIEPARLLLLAEASTARAFDSANNYDSKSKLSIPGLSISDSRSDSGTDKSGSDSRRGLRLFDGHDLYQAAFDALMTYDLLLDSSSRANDFAKTWQHRYDNSNRLESESGADQSVREMVRSLEQRFDYYNDRKAIEEKARRTSGDHVGIGVRRTCCPCMIELHVSKQESESTVKIRMLAQAYF